MRGAPRQMAEEPPHHPAAFRYPSHAADAFPIPGRDQPSALWRFGQTNRAPLGFGRLMAIHAVGRNEAQPVLIRPRLIGSCNESQQAAEHSRAKGSPTGRDGHPSWGDWLPTKAHTFLSFSMQSSGSRVWHEWGGKGIMGLIKNDPLHEGVVEGR